MHTKSILICFFIVFHFEDPNHLWGKSMKEFEIRLKETVELKEGLKLHLRYFSHKRPRVRGATMATAHLSLIEKNKSGGQETVPINLSVHGREGQNDAPKTFTDFTHGSYRFELIDFQYDESVTVLFVTVSEEQGK
jgi:hypothetical protein